MYGPKVTSEGVELNIGFVHLEVAEKTCNEEERSGRPSVEYSS